jgi:hypothetical protein
VRVWEKSLTKPFLCVELALSLRILKINFQMLTMLNILGRNLLPNKLWYFFAKDGVIIGCAIYFSIARRDMYAQINGVYFAG